MFKSIVEQNRQSQERERLLREKIESDSKHTKDEENKASTQRGGTGSDEGLAELADRFALLMIKERLYENPEINVNTVSEALNTNRTYLSKAINRATGNSFSEVITQYRIRRATEILSDPQNISPLKAISSMVGFSSMSAFYAAFRTQVGMTPTQFRKNSIEASKRLLKTQN